MVSLTEFYKEARRFPIKSIIDANIPLNSLIAGTAIGATHSIRMRNKRKKALEKKAFAPLIPLVVGAGIGALGGAATAPKGQRLSGALMGGAFGALTGGYGGAAMAGGKALLKGGLGAAGRASAGQAAKSSLAKTIATKGAPTAGGMARGAVINTGIGAALTGATGGYSQPTPQSRPFYRG